MGITEARQLSSAGRAQAQLELGWLLVETGDFQEAYMWFAMALDAGLDAAIEATEFLEASEKVSHEQIRDAYFEIGCWCEAGETVPLNVPAAVRLWQVAVALGHAEAEVRLRKWQ